MEAQKKTRKQPRSREEMKAIAAAKKATSPKADHPSSSLGARVQELERTVANLQDDVRAIMSLLDAKTAPAQPTQNALKVIR